MPEALIDQVRRLAGDLEINRVELEGPLVAIYISDAEVLGRQKEVVKQLAKGLRRRVDFRADAGSRKSTEDTRAVIEELVGNDAGITRMSFSNSSGEVFIEARSPGAVIGPGGSRLEKIRSTTCWVPRVNRAANFECRPLQDIRLYLDSVAEERRQYLAMLGERIYREPDPDLQNFVRLTSLGGWGEMGRCASLVSTRFSRVIVDFGVALDLEREEHVPLDLPELQPLEEIDAVVVTSAALSRCGMIPLLFRHGYAGPVYCTTPTRDLMAMQCADLVANWSDDDSEPPYGPEEIQELLFHTIPLGYLRPTDIAPDIRLNLRNAGTLLGSSSAHFNVGNGMHNVVITGHLRPDRSSLYQSADLRFPRSETLVVDATYALSHDSFSGRRELKQKLSDLVSRTAARGGNLLVAASAAGPAQEVQAALLELDRENALAEVPVFLDGPIWDVNVLFSTYPEFGHARARRGEAIDLLDEGLFHPVLDDSHRDEILSSSGPMVVIAPDATMERGPVLDYFEEWAANGANSLLFPQISPAATLATQIARGKREVDLADDLEVNMEITSLPDLSGLADRKQISDLISKLKPLPGTVFTHHGEDHRCRELVSHLKRKFNNITVRAPTNLETMRLR